MKLRRKHIILLVAAAMLGLCIFAGTLVLVFTIERDNWRLQPLRAAIDQNNAARIDAVLDAQPDLLELKNKLGQPPLIYAIWNNKETSVDALIRRGANARAPWSPGSNQWQSAHCAAAVGNIKIMQLVLDANVGVNEKSANGQTPLDVAIERNRVSLEEFLISKGAKRGRDLP